MNTYYVEHVCDETEECPSGFTTIEVEAMNNKEVVNAFINTTRLDPFLITDIRQKNTTGRIYTDAWNGMD